MKKEITTDSDEFRQMKIDIDQYRDNTAGKLFKDIFGYIPMQQFKKGKTRVYKITENER